MTTTDTRAQLLRKLSVIAGSGRVVWSGEFGSHAQAYFFADARFSRFSHTFKIEMI